MLSHESSQATEGGAVPGYNSPGDKTGHGCTRNFSTRGLYFLTDQRLAIGEQLEVVVLLEHTGLVPGCRIRYQGEVLRMEPLDESSASPLPLPPIPSTRRQGWMRISTLVLHIF